MQPAIDPPAVPQLAPHSAGRVQRSASGEHVRGDVLLAGWWNVAVMRCYVQDFGKVRLAVMESHTERRQIRTATEVVTEVPGIELWERLARVLRQADEWVEAQ